MRSKFPFAILMLSTLSITSIGCGHSEAVVEAPATEEVQEDIPAMEGMTDEEYTKAMEADE
ncbi:hypothetical protein LOC67_15620 [Stieleria sp. JC731]|uniref:hypothetical protein n=1 Tax=Pirellulaceae TaxID=2691357 RepID=UPI001E4C4331|nr:hypothetical protein [Stieleria sp. JC731]MCC9601990.1 hypothetical protein [Stieleria sp. JC731]